ncbi:MAG TPA: (d)CMP kinase, partial [Alphaproteobacteria bacterium]|nr:(d)CMP kinase [Alphaproteobacteria bacterium]
VGMSVMLARGNAADPVAAEKAARAFTYESLFKLGNDPILRGEQAAQAASKVAAIPAVREILLKFQQDFAANPPDGKPGTVLDGRDIGTVICPQAPVKIYVTASDEVRAQRRFKELQGRAENVTYATVLNELKERDARDANRSTAPAKPASDAVILDTSNMTADQAFAEALKIAEAKLKQS